MNKRIKKKHYDLKCENVELDELCWDYLKSRNISRCSNSLKKERKCPYYTPYKKARRWWQEFKQIGMKIYAREHLK